jgi:DNA-binding response OmpR family regulator
MEKTSHFPAFSTQKHGMFSESAEHRQGHMSLLQPAISMNEPMILLAEDEEMIRHSLILGLRRAGFRVQGFANGLLAYEAFQEGVTSLVITDIQMPLLDGLELVRRVLASKPELPILVMTGFGEESLSKTFEKHENCHLISKPFRMDVFLRKVAEVLDESPRLASPFAHV